MLLYQLRDRTISGPPRTYPAEAEICIRLSPEVPFGGSPGVTRNVVTDRNTKLRFNLDTGQAYVQWEEQLFDPLQVEASADDAALRVSGRNLCMYTNVTSDKDLQDVIAGLVYVLPAVLTVFLPDACHVDWCRGRVGGVEFRWLFDPTSLTTEAVVTSKLNQEEIVESAWRRVAVTTGHPRLVAGLVYFQTAVRLLVAGNNRYEFMAEALLNFSKSLQALFGEDRDEIREGLRELAVFSDAEIEGKFLTVTFLRNQFDIGHISLALLSREQLKTLHAYADIAEKAFRELFKTVLDRVAAGDYAPRPHSRSSLSSQRNTLLRLIAKNIKPFL